VPDGFALVRKNRDAIFSLQPSQPSSPNGKNASFQSVLIIFSPLLSAVVHAILDKFYLKHAKTREAKDWLREHPFEAAVSPDAETEWMAK
jgi:hypothetical protein